MGQVLPISIAIPTFGRGGVLLETVAALLALECRAAEILVVDQNASHGQATRERLQGWSDAGAIRWIRLPEPSITHAMNQALLNASQDLVLFVDDDVSPSRQLVAAHHAAHRGHSGVLVAGRVVQPWDSAEPQARSAFHFNQPQRTWAAEFMGGNFSLRREDAVRLGGFDENFVRVAYRFEAEFAHRWRASGGRILYEPDAMLHHLKAPAGGTRTWGEHLTTWRPDHAVGAYYFALRTGRLLEFLVRPARSVTTRFHLRHPWRIPPSLAAELAGMLWAFKLHIRGPKLVARPAPRP